MTTPLPASTIHHWLTTQVDQGHTQFTVHDLKSATDLLFPQQSFSMRTLYDVTRQYAQITGASIEKRLRRNFHEQVFTPEQMTELLTAIDRHVTRRLSYAEAFMELKGSSSGGTTPSSGHSMDELAALRAEVGELRSEVQALRESAMTRRDLWRVTVGTLLLSTAENQEHVAAIMEYMGVPDPESEVQALRESGLELPFKV